MNCNIKRTANEIIADLSREIDKKTINKPVNDDKT